MKKVLMALNSFLPAAGPCVARSAGFVRLLRNYGWEPVILTREISAPDTGDAPEGLEMPEGIDVYRTSPWELDELPGLLGFAGRRLGEWFLAPDKERLWTLFTRRKAARIVKNEGIDLIYTASPPKSSHLLGFYLKKRFPQLPWIADICAATSVNVGNPRSSLKAGVEKRTDRRVCEAADYIVSDSEGMLKALFEASQVRDIDGKCFTIPDGFAEELSGVFEKSCRLLAAKRLVQK